jgi:bacteriorhodopsin
MTAQLWLYLDAILMLAGGAIVLVVGKGRTDKEHAHTMYHGIVPMIAACAYFAMAVGQGGVTLPSGRLFYFARYVDWSFTTPLLLLPLCYTAVHSRLRRGDLIAGVLLADLLMIVTAFVFGASTVVWVKWTWFLISCVAFLVVLWAMWVPLLRENASEPALVQEAYKRDAGILTVLWIIYPLILFVDPDGTGLVGSATGVALIAVIDLLSKPVYGLISVAGMTRIVDDELSGSGGGKIVRRAA